MAETTNNIISGSAPAGDYQGRYPWHAESWQRLTARRDRFPHALLLHGPPGLGKRAFAWRLAHWLLCGNPGSGAEPCNVCPSCVRFIAGTHPDLSSVGLAEDSAAIGIDQIRAVRDFVVLTPHTAARKLVIIDPAERMNVNAANALLKVLEEPPSASALVLVTPQLARLPATIRSRCAAIAFRTPPPADALAWLSGQGIEAAEGLLQFAAGAPLSAAALANSSERKDHEQVREDIVMLRKGSGDPLSCASRWKNYGTERCLTWFQMYLANAARDELVSGKNTFYLKDLFAYFDVVSNARAQAQGPLDQALLLEDLLVGWAGIFRRVG